MKLILVNKPLQIIGKLNKKIYVVWFIRYIMKRCESSYICIQNISSYMFSFGFIKLLCMIFCYDIYIIHTVYLIKFFYIILT